MKYTHKSFSVSMGGGNYADNWDRIFKGTTSTTAEAPAAPEGAAEDYSQRQCAACLERGHIGPMAQDGEDVPGLLQCGLCLARFPLGIEQAQKVTGEAACPNCDGTGHLRTTYTVFACAACGGTGARQP